MPNRIPKESVCVSESVDRLPFAEECFFYRLIVNCDDYDRMDARPAILRTCRFPPRALCDAQIDSWLLPLQNAASSLSTPWPAAPMISPSIAASVQRKWRRSIHCE